MKIASIKAFKIVNPIAGGIYDPRQDHGAARRDPWTKDAVVASPMSRYPRYAAQRSSWKGDFPAVGCIVTTEDGSWGYGAGQHGVPSISLINDHLGPLLVGENPLATDKIYDMMVRMASPYSAFGLASYAISAIDLAMWDLKGKLLKTPVYALAGGPARDRQFCYATGNDTDWHVELGFTATKLAGPAGTADGLEGLDRNEELIARTREQVGPSFELMLDCWMSGDVEYSVRLAERLRPYKLRWLEECLIPENMPAHRALRARLPWQTLATGEHWYTPYPFFEAASDRMVDILQPDIQWVGGFTACQRISAIAEAAGLEVILHLGMNTPWGQHFSFASQATRWGEFFVGGAPGVALTRNTGYPGLALPENGWLVPSDEPGFGHGLTLDAIDSMTIS